VGNGSTDVGTRTPTRKPVRPMVERLVASSESRSEQPKPLTKARPRISSAMAQQCGDSGRGNQSAPQKLVQLVGCRETNARPKPWVRPDAVLVKG